MNRNSSLFVVVSLAGFLSVSAVADIFQFRDLRGFEKCLSTNHLEEQTKTDAGTQKRYLSDLEIEERCIDKAVVLLSEEKNPEKIAEFIEATRSETAVENALPLVTLLVSKHLASCNEMKNYKVFLKGLSYPKSRIDKELQAQLKKGVKLCLKDSEFRKDFLEEKDNSDAFIKENACEILKEEKLTKNCESAKN